MVITGKTGLHNKKHKTKISKKRRITMLEEIKEISLEEYEILDSQSITSLV